MQCPQVEAALHGDSNLGPGRTNVIHGPESLSRLLPPASLELSVMRGSLERGDAVFLLLAASAFCSGCAMPRQAMLSQAAWQLQRHLT